MGDSATVVVSLDAGPDSDAAEVSDLTTKLRRELLQLDVDSVERPVEGPAPEGTRALDVVAIGTLIVNLVKASKPLQQVVDAVRNWLGSNESRSVRIEMDGDVLEIAGASSTDQERLITAWIDRHSK
jgi:hypothetical protein